jgi:hypothetical protein
VIAIEWYSGPRAPLDDLFALADDSPAAVSAYRVHDALARGCRTASLQSTEMAEGMYTALGFRDLGRILEFAPPVTA